MVPNTKLTGNAYYVRAITKERRVVGYGVYDCEGGIEIEHKRYMVGGLDAERCLADANRERDSMNGAA